MKKGGKGTGRNFGTGACLKITSSKNLSAPLPLLSVELLRYPDATLKPDRVAHPCPGLITKKRLSHIMGESKPYG